MLKLTRQAEYALIALKHMHIGHPGQIIAVREICDDHHIPFDATARVLRNLAVKEIVQSSQGANGGYQLLRDLKTLSVYEFLETIIGPVELAACMGVSCSCKLVESCNIISPMALLNNRLVTFYKSINLGELFDGSSPDEALIRERFSAQQTPASP